MAHYNTNNLTGENLLCEQHKTEKQYDLVFQIFKENQGVKMTWCDTLRYFKEYKELPFGKPIRENSLKRAITDLYNDGKIKKGDKTVKADFGYCHQYYLE